MERNSDTCRSMSEPAEEQEFAWTVNNFMYYFTFE